MPLGRQMAPAEKFRYILSCEIKRVIKSNFKKKNLASLCYIYKTRKHVGKRAICQTKLPMSKCQKAFEASILQLLLLQGLPVRRLSACSIEVLKGQQIKIVHKQYRKDLIFSCFPFFRITAKPTKISNFNFQRELSGSKNEEMILKFI